MGAKPYTETSLFVNTFPSLKLASVQSRVQQWNSESWFVMNTLPE